MIVLVMGVTGSGKTTLGQSLAKHLNLPFYDADDFHPPSNRAKLMGNIPLGDADRLPWLQSLAQLIPQWEKEGGAVLACSALKEKYRAILTLPSSSLRVVYIKGSAQVIAERLRARAAAGHVLIKDYSRILEGQFRDLEEPRNAINVPMKLDVEEATAQVVKALSA